MPRAPLFAGTGLACFAYWLVQRPSMDMPASMTEWPTVIWFSATLLVLADALHQFGRMLGGRRVGRLAAIAAAGIALSGLANVVEDGFRVDEAFFAFILGMLILEIGLLAISVVIVRTTTGRDRLLALVPTGTFAGILLFVAAGGPILLATWLSAAAAPVVLGRRRAMLED